MTGGITTYGRSDGEPAGDPSLAQLDAAIDRIQLAAGGASTLDGDVADALDQLKRLAAAADNPAMQDIVVERKRRLLGLAFRRRDELGNPHAYQAAMQLGTDAWKAQNPIAASPLGASLQQAEAAYVEAKAAGDLKALRASSEMIGVLHTTYEMSAFLGEHLLEAGSVLPPATDGSGNYFVEAAPDGTARSMICGTSYNTNIVFVREIAGERIVLVGEAKGGTSKPGSTKVTSRVRGSLKRMTLPKVICQDQYLYALRCAAYMSGAKRPDHAMAARRSIGKAILNAHTKAALSFSYVSAGIAQDGADLKVKTTSRIALP